MDISEERLKQLEKTEKQYETLVSALDEASMGFALADAEGQVQFSNRRLRDITRHTPGRRLTEAVHPDDRQQYIECRAQCINTGSEGSTEVRCLDKQGEIHWIRVIIKPLQNIRGAEEPSHLFMVIVEDITEKKRTEEELLDSRHKLSTHVELTPMGIIDFDNNFIITSWNPGAEKIFGYSRDEAIGRNTFDLIVPRYERQLVQQIHQINSPESNENINDNLTKDGRTITVQWFNTPIRDREGNLIGMTAACQDITEQLKTQKMLIQSEKMISVGGLAAGMAHEINNPLGAIMQVSQNLKRRLDPTFEKNQEIAEKYNLDLKALQSYLEERDIYRFIEAIMQSGKRAARIITDMLHFSRKSDSEKKLLDINVLMEHALDLAKKDYDLKKKYDFRHIKIARELDASLNSVPCSETEIEQVLLNLLKNCAQAISECPDRKPPRITLRTIREAETARIEIEDNGPGMEASVRSRIFEPFFTTKPVGEGTGLGLSVSYSIITGNHGGTLEVESEPGKGARFIIRLPLKTNDPSNSPAG